MFTDNIQIRIGNSRKLNNYQMRHRKQFYILSLLNEIQLSKNLNFLNLSYVNFT